MVNISKDVISGIVNLTLEGIKGIQQSKSNDPRRKAIKVERDGDAVLVETQVQLDYNSDMLKLCTEAQRNITENIELMTGLKVRAVNVVVQNIVAS